jgi:hypothetical protein
MARDHDFPLQKQTAVFAKDPADDVATLSADSSRSPSLPGGTAGVASVRKPVVPGEQGEPVVCQAKYLERPVNSTAEAFGSVTPGLGRLDPTGSGDGNCVSADGAATGVLPESTHIDMLS